MTQDLVPTHRVTLPDLTELGTGFREIKAFQALVHQELVPGKDYGVIPGTEKPTLLKPGAEKMAKLLGLADTYTIEHSIEDWDRPLFRYLIKCRLLSIVSGICISEGLGECNSMEARYRWRNAKRVCPQCSQPSIIKGREEYGGGWVCFKREGGCGATFKDTDTAIMEQPLGKVPNDDIFSLVNTILKMARKRALVDAALSAGRLSDLFTQDMEDVIDGEYTITPVAEAKRPPQRQPAQRSTSTAKETAQSTSAMPWTAFWPKAYALVGSRNQVDVHRALGIEALNADWIAKGYTREEALHVLTELTTGRTLDQIIHEDLPPRSNDAATD